VRRPDHRADDLPARLADEVPQRNIDARDRMNDDAAPAVVACQVIHPIPDCRDIGDGLDLLPVDRDPEPHRMAV
jgi:hypothetical protein